MKLTKKIKLDVSEQDKDVGVLKAFKYRLYPNKAQENKLFWTLTRCRELYNAGLSERKDAYKYERKSITYRMQQNDLPEIKNVIEELQIANITKAPELKQDEATGKYLPNGAAAKAGLNKSILDAGWGTFQQMCTYKAAWASRTVMKVDPKFTSQACSRCGTLRKKELSERWHSCECGCELDRDTNAAINILRKGKQQLFGLEDANRETCRSSGAKA